MQLAKGEAPMSRFEARVAHALVRAPGHSEVRVS